MASADRTVTIHLIQGGVAIVVALIAAFGGGYTAGQSRSDEQDIATARFAPGILVRPAEMTKEQCAARMVQALSANGIVLSDSDTDAGKRVEGNHIMGFWCAKRQVLFYYGVAPQLEDAQKLRRTVKVAALSIGAREAPDE
jgi:hypothetical protein